MTGRPVSTTPVERVALDAHEAAASLGIGVDRIYRMVRAGELVPVPYSGRKLLFDLNELRRFASGAPRRTLDMRDAS